MTKINETVLTNDELDQAVSDLYEAAIHISANSGLSVASITGSINHTHEKRLLGKIAECQPDLKENTSLKFTEH